MQNTIKRISLQLRLFALWYCDYIGEQTYKTLLNRINNDKEQDLDKIREIIARMWEPTIRVREIKPFY
jgi:hypothetical protein